MAKRKVRTEVLGEGAKLDQTALTLAADSGGHGSALYSESSISALGLDHPDDRRGRVGLASVADDDKGRHALFTNLKAKDQKRSMDSRTHTHEVFDSVHILKGQKTKAIDDTLTVAETRDSQDTKAPSQLRGKSRTALRRTFAAKVEMFNVDREAEKRKFDLLNLHKKNRGYDIDEYEQEHRIGQEAKVSTFFPELGFNYRYDSDTSDEDTKYVTRKNSNFRKWPKKRRQAHVMALWNTCRVKAFTAAVSITIFNSIRTKVAYFGR